jgi:predicted ATPase/DNA-binding winged helix-turn-helix (wHTH) protein
MPTSVAERGLSFRDGEIRIDFGARLLTVNSVPAKLGNRAFDLLEALIERRGRLVPKQELMDVVWPGLVVEENNLQVHVMTLRKLLGSDAIVTVSGRGYRFALTPDGEVATRPPPEAASGGRAAAAAQLFGREALTASVCALLRRPDVRLVTLTGAGGSGKTRVALQVSAELAHDFADGSYIAMLAPVREPKLVASTIAAVLQVQEAGNRPPEELLIAHLKTREVLLTLDNFEHLIEAVPFVTRLLEACLRLNVLVTSRAVLRVAAEHDIVVPPLGLPDVSSNAKRALGAPAVQLFVERAKTAGRPVSVDHDILTVAQICRHLDGLPLALELAAARLKVFTPQTLLERLDHRLQVLKSAVADLPDRQRTLRNAIGWSYDLLEDPHKQFFRRLSVFSGGWSLRAAESVAGDDDDFEAVVDGLELLVDQSLVQRSEDVSGEPRFMMLETVREYAFDQLERHSEAIATRRRHAKFFLHFAEDAEPRLTSAGRRPWLEQLQAEVHNLRAALRFSLEERRDIELGLSLAAALPWMWYFLGHYGEGRRWVSTALSLANADAHRVLMAKLLSGAARLAMYGGDPTAAIALAQQSVESWRSIDDRRGLAFGLFHLAIPCFVVGRAEARDYLSESLRCFVELGDPWGIALAKTYLGVALTYSVGDEDKARPLLIEGRARFAALEDEWGLTTSSHYLGTIALRQGDYVGARELTNEMMRNALELGDNYRVARNLHQLAEIAIAEKKYTEAIGHLKSSLSLNREQSRIGDGAQQLRLLARLELLEGRPDHTVRLLAAASTLSTQDRTLPPDDPTVTESVLSEARRLLGDRRHEHEWSMGLAMSWERAVSWALAV